MYRMTRTIHFEMHLFRSIIHYLTVYGPHQTVCSCRKYLIRGRTCDLTYCLRFVPVLFAAASMLQDTTTLQCVVDEGWQGLTSSLRMRALSTLAS